MGASSPPPADASDVAYRKCFFLNSKISSLTLPPGACQVGGALVGFAIPLAVLFALKMCMRKRKAKQDAGQEAKKEQTQE
jgi:hypothetical protein